MWKIVTFALLIVNTRSHRPHTRINGKPQYRCRRRKTQWSQQFRGRHGFFHQAARTLHR
jgi:hypothetical protein